MLLVKRIFKLSDRFFQEFICFRSFDTPVWRMAIWGTKYQISGFKLNESMLKSRCLDRDINGLTNTNK